MLRSATSSGVPALPNRRLHGIGLCRYRSAAREYLTRLPLLPKGGDERYRFIFGFLGDHEIPARDAYDEFEALTYAQLRDLRPTLKREQLLGWIRDHEIPTSRRRLAFRMLGICGSKDVGEYSKSCSHRRTNVTKQHSMAYSLVTCICTPNLLWLLSRKNTCKTQRRPLLTHSRPLWRSGITLSKRDC